MPEFPDRDGRLVLEPGCARCPALVECRERISWGNGPVEKRDTTSGAGVGEQAPEGGSPSPDDAEVMVVGEAPGYGDPDADRWRGGNWTGMAYTSRHSGRRIRETMADAGRPDAYYTNAVKCFPADPEEPTTNRDPTAEELATCRDHLLTELDLIDPAVAVTTGKHATRSLLAADGLTIEDVADGFLDAVLDPVECPSLDVTCLPLLHPSYRDVWLSRLGYDREEYVAALRRHLDRLVD